MVTKFEFVRIKHKNSKTSGDIWYFKADSVEKLDLHTEKILRPLFQEALDTYSKTYIEKLSNKKCHYSDGTLYVPHATNKMEEQLRRLSEIKYGTASPSPVTLYQIASDLLIQTIVNRRTLLNKYGVVYLENGVRQFGYNNITHEIAQVIISATFNYPVTRKVTINDVRYISWDNGIHVYAKVGNHDIVDKNGNQKWNTKEEAQNAAQTFLQYNEIYI
jgi:hypothetical protein